MPTESRPSGAKPSWYESQWVFFWTLVSALLTAGAIAGLAGWLLLALLTNNETRGFSTAIESTGPAHRVSRPRPPASGAERLQGTSIEVITEPPRTTDECLEQTDGVLNEQFKKCRSGYTYQRFP